MLTISLWCVQDGRKVHLTRVARQRDEWPDYDSPQLALPPAAARDQYSHQLAIAAAEEQTGGSAAAAPAVASSSRGRGRSPWHLTYAGIDAEDGAAQQLGAGSAAATVEQQRMAAAGAQLAAAAAQAQQMRMVRQQQAAWGQRQSTAAAAEADEFDAGLFKEAAGECNTVLPRCRLAVASCCAWPVMKASLAWGCSAALWSHAPSSSSWFRPNKLPLC